MKDYKIIKLLGKVFLATRNNKNYTFGNKIEAELRDYQKLLKLNIRIPRMIDVDLQRENTLNEIVSLSMYYQIR
jgi:hypothetical protein